MFTEKDLIYVDYQDELLDEDHDTEQSFIEDAILKINSRRQMTHFINHYMAKNSFHNINTFQKIEWFLKLSCHHNKSNAFKSKELDSFFNFK